MIGHALPTPPSACAITPKVRGAQPSINWPISDCMASHQDAEQEQTDRPARTIALDHARPRSSMSMPSTCTIKSTIRSWTVLLPCSSWPTTTRLIPVRSATVCCVRRSSRRLVRIARPSCSVDTGRGGAHAVVTAAAAPCTGAMKSSASLARSSRHATVASLKCARASSISSSGSLLSEATADQ